MKRFATMLIVVLLFSPFACSDDSTGPGGGTGTPPGTVENLFGDLAEALAAIGDLSEADLRNVRFDDFRDGFEDVLVSDPDNPGAHLGLAIVELLELNYNANVWALVDDIEAWSNGPSPTAPNRHRTLIGRQFELMVEIPLNFYGRLATDFPGDISIARIQDVIRDEVMPALDRAITHITETEQHTDAELRLMVSEVPPEYVVIDLGEIFVFDAALHALRSCFGSLIAYDVDLFGPDGTYDWVFDMENYDSYPSYCGDSYMVTTGTPFDTLDIYDNQDGQASADSILLSVLHYNLTSRSQFLALRQGAAPLQAAHSDLNGVVQRLGSAVNFIRNIRTGETEENVIKLADLTGLDADIAGGGSRPNFAQNWTKIEDVLNFVSSLLAGGVLFNENLGPYSTPFSFTLNLKALYIPGVADWKALLPYHQWMLPATGRWLMCQTSMYSYNNGGSTWFGYLPMGGYCTYTMLDNIDLVRNWYTWCDLPADQYIQLLDGPGGNPIDLGTEKFPYFPNYTFGGLFPDMNRTRWIQLVDILGGSVEPPVPPPAASR